MFPITREALRQKIEDGSTPLPETGCWLWGGHLNATGALYP